MSTKITLVSIFLQITTIQVFTRGLVLRAPAAAVESQLANIRHDLRLVVDDFNDRIETVIQEKLKDVLCTVCKTNTTIPPTPTTTENPKTKPRTCHEWLQETGRSDVYKIKASATSNLTFEAYCYLRNNGTDITYWTVILRRNNWMLNFNRTWADYQRGFGNLYHNFILGLDYIHELTRSAQHELWVGIQHQRGVTGSAKYDNFRIGNSTESYELKSIGRYSGNMGDSLKHHLGYKWTTLDKDNDDNPNRNCAFIHEGAWWFVNCMDSCLTCSWYKENEQVNYGIMWKTLDSRTCHITYTHMAIRSVEK